MNCFMSELKLVAFGDVQPGKTERNLFEGVGELSTSADMVFCNLEGPITSRDSIAIPKLASLRSDPFCIEQLVKARVSVVSFANNHGMDYGIDAFLDTLDLLRKNGIKFAGAGDNLSMARRPATVSIKGMKIAFLAYASFFDIGAQATDTKPGLVPVRVDPLFDSPHLNKEDVEEMIRDIKLAKKSADLVVVSHHWGVSMSETLTAYQKSLAHSTIDAGADLVLGSHPHILQGIEVYKGKCVFYSLGNFIFEAYPTWFDARTINTMLVSAAISQRNISSVEIHPMRRKDGVRPFRLGAKDKAFGSIADYLEHNSRQFGTRLDTEGEVIRVRL